MTTTPSRGNTQTTELPGTYAAEFFDHMPEDEVETPNDYFFLTQRERIIPALHEYLQEMREQGVVAGI